MINLLFLLRFRMCSTRLRKASCRAELSYVRFLIVQGHIRELSVLAAVHRNEVLQECRPGSSSLQELPLDLDGDKIFSGLLLRGAHSSQGCVQVVEAPRFVRNLLHGPNTGCYKDQKPQTAVLLVFGLVFLGLQTAQHKRNDMIQ